MSELYQDLLIDSSESFEDGDYFVVTIEDLDPGRIYSLQFKWKYKDGTSGKDWSAAYDLVISSEQVPGAPAVTANGDTPGMITITWNGKNIQNTDIQDRIKQVDIYISGSPFDGTKPAISFDKAGTKTVSAPAGLYNIVAYGLTARGTVSTQTTISNITVTDISAPVEAPTLPSGLSVAAAPFAVSVNWAGTYASSDFDGFKSIDIHVRGSDVGSTATSGFSTTTQVATLTVTGTTNRQNIGLDNLRQALSLANNQAAYTNPMFFYYIARNVNDALYSVGGTPTYTRINSTTVNPTQANFIDLASGVISIENLVAGNGQFSSWLRTGSAGGTRIELSAVNDFTNGGNTVQKGLVAYSSGSTEIFNLDIDAGTLTINGSGTFTGDLSAGSGSSIFKSDSDGIYLGATTFAGAADKFRVSRSGVMNAASGTIGGLALGTNSISNSAGTFAIGNTGQLRLGSEAVGQPNFLITPTQLVHRTGSTASGKFTLDINTGVLTLGDYATTGQLATKIGAADVNPNVTSISGGVISTGTINLNNVNVNNGTGNNSIRISSSGLELYNGSGTRTVYLNPSGGSASFTGTITGSTISGGLITTTNQRIRINDTADQITFHPSSASNIGRLYMSSTSTVGQLLLEAPYNSTRAFLQMDTFGDTPSVELSASTGTVQLTGNIVRLNSTGSFYTGNITNDPASQTDGSYMGNDGQVNVRRSGNTPLHVHRYTGSGNRRMLTFYLSGSGAGGINADGSVAPTFAAPSDYRLKENIRDFIDASSVIKKAKLKVFNFKNKPDIDVVGFIAHELAEVDPRLATGIKDDVDKNGDPVYQDAMPGGLITYLTGALKETILKVEELQQRLDALEG